MTDRELLKFAAKAAGIEGDGGYYWAPDGEAWNPLINDGDALGLAAKLRLELRFLDLDHPAGPPRVTFHNVSGLVELAGNDLLAATRRAIVRAAAEIGRTEK